MFSFSNLLSFCSFSWIKASKLCCYINFVDSSATFCRGSNSQLLRLNSTYEFAFSIFNFSLLGFHCRLLMCPYASLVCTSQGIINDTWGIMWLTSLSYVHGCFYYDWKIVLGVTNCWSISSTLKLLSMATPFSTYSCTITWSNCLLKLLITIIFSISPHCNYNLNNFLHYNKILTIRYYV
jgi:hypothetical protein